MEETKARQRKMPYREDSKSQLLLQLLGTYLSEGERHMCKLFEIVGLPYYVICIAEE